MVGDNVLTFDTRGIGLVSNDNRFCYLWTVDVTMDMMNYLMDFGGHSAVIFGWFWGEIAWLLLKFEEQI
jgi:hypothetical protein